MNGIEAVQALEIIGFMFSIDDNGNIRYNFSPETLPPASKEVLPLFEAIRKDRKMAIAFIRKSFVTPNKTIGEIEPVRWTTQTLFKHLSENIRISERLRAGILKTNDREEAFRNAIECIARMTGDSAWGICVRVKFFREGDL